MSSGIPRSSIADLKQAIVSGLEKYRNTYTEYYNANKETGSPALRDANPSVVLIPGVGMFTFAKNKKEARITAEFYINAIHVMAGATALGAGAAAAAAAGSRRPPAGEDSRGRACLHESCITTLRCHLAKRSASSTGRSKKPRSSACRPSRSSAARSCSSWVAAAASGAPYACSSRVSARTSWRPTKMQLQRRKPSSSSPRSQEPKQHRSCEIDICNRQSIRAALEATIAKFGGVDSVINTAAIFLPPKEDGTLDENHWRITLDVNVTGNYLLADETKKVLLEQGLSVYHRAHKFRQRRCAQARQRSV